MLPLAGGVNVLLLIGVVIGVIALWSLFLTATSDPGVHLRSTDRGEPTRWNAARLHFCHLLRTAPDWSLHGCSARLDSYRG
jgi:hypothetical protein